MIRRQRRPREIAFSFDSFLDVVANVVGIIIRLILVVWVGARSYGTLTAVPPPASATSQKARKSGEPEDPLQQELARHRRELAATQARLLEQLRQVRSVQTREEQARSKLGVLAARRRELDQQRAKIDRQSADHQSAAQAAALSLAELRQKTERLRVEIRELEKQPRLKQTLRYHTPVSEPVDAEEIMFECRRNRVTFVDTAALLGEVKRSLDEKGKLLQTQWQVQDVAGPVGAFRLHYTLERQRSLFDSIGRPAAPAGRTGFSYGLSEWHLEPLTDQRGEAETTALAEGSEFRQVVDLLDPRQTVVTLWVYPDSFALYRRLRDYLYERDVVVAGRPLPEGATISCSRQGSRSRGQ
jgi:hypothetical protein